MSGRDASRRDFLKAAALGGAAASWLGFDLQPAYAQLSQLKIARATETRSTCPYCSVSCGVRPRASARDDPTTGDGGAGTACSGGCGTVFSLTPPATPGG